jgi:hypothetical protein
MIRADLLELQLSGSGRLRTQVGELAAGELEQKNRQNS